MNPDEAKFLLRARRPGGRDANDPVFAEALAAAERDPLLKAWHEREERRDAVLGAKLGEVPVPADLRAALLAGGRVSRAPAAWWRRPGWLAAAATVALLIVGTAAWRGRANPELDELARLAMAELEAAHDSHVGRPGPLRALQARLAEPGRGVRAAGPIDVEELRRSRCRAVTLGGREVFELCFAREGVWFHLYVSPGGRSGGATREIASASGGRLVAAVWSDARNSYALVTAAGSEALRRAW